MILIMNRKVVKQICFTERVGGRSMVTMVVMDNADEELQRISVEDRTFCLEDKEDRHLHAKLSKIKKQAISVRGEISLVDVRKVAIT